MTLALAIVPLGIARAGPPFVTDDPEPTDYQHFEIYLYVQDTPDGGTKVAPQAGLEVNYGALPNLQVSVSLPAGFGAPGRVLAGSVTNDTEFGAKYRFIEEDEDGWRPQVSFYPSVEAAIGGSEKSGADSAAREFLPLWVQKSVGSWTTFGGGGYHINPAPGGINSWFVGWAILRRLGDRLQLGTELYRSTAESPGDSGLVGFNVGAIYDLNSTLHLVGSAGSGLSGRTAGKAPSYYFALEWTP